MIEFCGVTHVYRRWPDRGVCAVADFSLSVAAGEVVGLAGPNGAGKTTLISLLLGYVRPTSGTVLVGGLTPRQYTEQSGVGYVPELVVINREWRLREALVRLGLLDGLPRTELRQHVNAMMGDLALDEHQRKLIRELSKGTLQRLGLAQALLQRHAIVIFDEPTHGLDPVWTHRFRDLVEALRGPDRTILIASHNLDELQRLADRVVLIDRGSVQRIVDLRAVNETGGMRYRIEVARGGDLVHTVFPGALAVGSNAFELPTVDATTLNVGLVALVGAGALITSIVPARTSLEQHFREAINQ